MFSGYLIICILVWLYVLSVLKRAHLKAFFFWTGSVGLFLIICFMSKLYFVWLIARIVTYCLLPFEHVIHGLNLWIPYNMMIIKTTSFHIVQLSITYECSGALEIIAFESLLIFFPIYNRGEKVLIGFSGFWTVIFINVIRLIFVVIFINAFGMEHLFIFHSIIGRLLFYILIVMLYYTVFTKAQVIHGWLKKEN